jgi:hypothetical protein
MSRPIDHEEGFSNPGLSLAKLAGESDKTVVSLHVEEIQVALEFLDLPREIRDSIYSIMFFRHHCMYPSKEGAGISAYLGLLGTNRQVYSEAIMILYGRNTFQIRGTPAWKATEFLNLVASQRRDGQLHALLRSLNLNTTCQARLHLKKLYVPSYNISLDRLKHLFSLLKYFPYLESIRVIYLSTRGIKDMEVVNVCRLLRDFRPLLKSFVLCRRIAYSEVEDISWMLWEKPYRAWSSVSGDATRKHVWENEDGISRKAEVISAPQNIAE